MHFMAGESVPVSIRAKDHMMRVLFINMLLFMLQAMCFQHKATMIFERVLGVDHPDTVAAYVSIILTFSCV